MSAPPGEGYGQYSDQQYDEQQPHAGGPDPGVAAGGKKKKRGYAAGAFDVGSGANSAVGGQTQGGVPPQYGAQYGQQPMQPDPQQQPAAQGFQQGYPAAQQGYPGAQQQAQPPQPQYGYQAPDQGYPAPGAAPGGVAGITQGMGGMQIGGQPQQQQQQTGPASQQPRAVMNQLYPTDLLNQPFNASELDLPPPPINLPPNVS